MASSAELSQTLKSFILFQERLKDSSLSTHSHMEHRISKRKQSQGRRKIEIKKIENKTSRQVTFSKRRSGLFRKASELCVLCGAEAAICVVSPKGKVFTFGHPNVEAIIDRYEQKVEETSCNESARFDVADINRHLEKLRVLEAERNQLKEVNKQEMEKNVARGKDPYWWNKDTRGMGLAELEKFRDALEELKNNVNRKAEEKAMTRAMSSADYHQQAIYDEDTKRVIYVPSN